MKTILNWTLLGAGAFGMGLGSASTVEAWATTPCPPNGLDPLGRYVFQIHSVDGADSLDPADSFPAVLIGVLPPAPSDANGQYALWDDDSMYVVLGSPE